MLLECKYEKDKNQPWACKNKDINYDSAKNVFTEYPDKLRIFSDGVFLSLSENIVCNIDASKNLKCGDDHTLKLSEDNEIIALKKPKHFYERIILSNFKPNLTLWAKEIEFSYSKNENLVFKVNKDILTKGELTNIINWKPYITTHAQDEYDVEVHIPRLKGESYKSEFKDLNVRPVTISKDYQKKWGLFEALREWFANAHDVTETDSQTKVYTDENNNLVIEYDSDIPLELRHLVVLGSHEEYKGKISIGQFGEGITLGCLVFARMGIPVKIESIGRTYYPDLKYDYSLKSELLHIYHKKNERNMGTKLTFRGIPLELIEIAKDTFLFNRKSEYTVLHSKENLGEMIDFRNEKILAVRELIIRGKEAQKIKSYFSYNLYDKQKRLVNRDRDFVAAWSTRRILEEILVTVKDEKIVRTILDIKSDREECKKYSDIEDLTYVGSEVKETWIRVLREVILDKYGTKYVAIKSNEPWADNNIKRLGYEILDWGYNGNRLLSNLGISHSNEIPGAEGKPRLLGEYHLKQFERNNLETAKKNTSAVLKSHYNEKKPEDFLTDIYVAKGFEGTKEMEQAGKEAPFHGMVREGKIYVHRDALSNPKIATGVMLHEMVHRYTHTHDETVPFELELTKIAGFSTVEWQENKEMFKKAIRASGQISRMHNLLGG